MGPETHLGLAMDDMTSTRPAPGWFRDLAFERDVVKLHQLGARAIVELLRDVGAQTMKMTTIESKVADFADLDPGVVRAMGGDDFGPAPIHLVKP